MYVVSFKVRKTGKEGKWYHESIDSARAEETRLKKDRGLKSIKLQKLDM